ncbi:acyl-CoA thioesterase II [Talaromyces proteolyticus]|uniref:Acyl-CoA thioesterase II n=1 Tax=Talaromyces proteolyticus TaxID=1131652 RepID=A0AAD4L4K9_9EURO|nr:acyl-CoA thioesterase II [Talaromyces proteolyticus]KAH8705862.1 acyl-CoA thioesterase II [Talaromyces proteolyticus]
MDDSFAHHIAVDRLSDWIFQSRRLAEPMGNTLPISYGGYTIALAINAAAKTVPGGFRLYSAMGNYLGPASTKRKVTLTVFSSRSTKTFQTRRVQVSQITGDGSNSTRICLELLADFQKAEPELLNFSTPPKIKYSHWKNCLPIDDLKIQMIKTGRISSAQAKAFDKMFGLLQRLFNVRLCPESIAGQTLMGIGKDIQTTQDHLPITEKTSSQWFQPRQPVNEESDHVAGLAFMLDGALSFLPLIHNHMFLNDVSACSSLDFAFRIFSPNVNLNNWHLRENVTHVGAHGRTYSESRVWDESGNMVASMTQQSILRPHQVQKL